MEHMDEFYTAYPLIKQLYGVELTPEDFEEIGLIAWKHIGNKFTKLYRYSANLICDTPPCRNGCGQKVEGFSMSLPCNCDILEAVTYGWEDWKYTTNKTVNGDYSSQFTENYIETRKITQSPLYISGRYVKYERVGDKLYFDRDYGTINILYKGVVLDSEGLTYITEKEALAIATYCAMTRLRRDGLVSHNNAILQEYQMLYQEWLKLCSAARVPYYINQNEWNEILDANSSWDRKRFNFSFKPIH